MDDFVGALVADRYTIERELGRGGMAVVWLARDRQHDRFIALKIVHPDLAGAIGVDRFLREVRLTAALQHPTIVPILDSGVVRGPDGVSLPWYAMPYLAGESLRARLDREHQLPIDEALRITELVAGALQVAHRQGIIHRDIKPENVLLANGAVYVVDFGIAKALIETGGARLTNTGLVIGTPGYMSPEQSSADEVDARTDQYSLATILYEMLAGDTPFGGPTAQAIIARRLSEPARPLHAVRSTVPEPVERAVLKALERVPADRFPDVAGFVAALRDSTPSGTSRRVPRPGSRRALVGAGLLAVAAVGAWLVASRSGRVGAHTATAEVVALYQRGLRGYDRRTPDGIVEAITAFGAAIARDSAYAPAWNALAKAYIRAEERQFAVPGIAKESLVPRAVTAVDRALAIDSSTADAWLTRGMISFRVDPTDDGAPLRAIRQSIRLDSTQAAAWHFMARIRAETGDLTGGIEAWRHSVRAGPTYTQGLAFLALGHYWRHQYDSAAVWADSAIALDPNYLLGRTTAAAIAVERGDFARGTADFDAARRISTGVEVVNALAGLGLVEARAGRRPEARVIIHRADSLAVDYQPVPLHTAVYLASAYVALGDRDRAVQWLSRYEPQRDLHFQLHLRCDPTFEPVKGDQRFRGLLTLPAPPPGRGC